MKLTKRIKKWLAGGTLALGIVALTGCASLDSAVKGIESDVKGLDRVVTVYDMAGNVIFEGEGTIRIDDTEYGNKVVFLLDGKRYAFYNATVSTIEK